ncbi:MAG: universal stress protein [Deltaproteobacteria bacterium]|nr:universal stress protein [Deltaproteobacteria bacterium]MBI3078077.1 universal stress protein [Deltaproteobacteria bacterium]
MPVPYERVLAAVDLKAVAPQVLGHAVALARASGAALRVVHVVYDLRDFTGVFLAEEGLPKLQAEMVRAGERGLEELCQGVDYPLERRVLVGDPFIELMREAEAYQPDLLVIGAHGVETYAHKVFGSTAHKVVNHARCSVLCVRA